MRARAIASRGSSSRPARHSRIPLFRPAHSMHTPSRRPPRMRRFCAAFALVAFATAAAAADYKIGFVNTERLFREATPAKRAQAKSEKEFATRDAEIQKLAKQVRDLQSALDRDGATMSDADRRNK